MRCLALFCVLALFGCDDGAASEGDSGALRPDAGVDAGSSSDAGPALVDAGVRDAGPAISVDAGDSGIDASIPEVPHAYSCTAIGRSTADGIFSLASFNARLVAGEFGYGRSGQSMVTLHPDREVPDPGLRGIGESVCALEVFGGMLYANTEDSGDIFRSADGSSWERVHDGAGGVIGCGLEVFDGQLYAVNFNHRTASDGRILRSADGSRFSEVWSGSERGWSPYVREIVAHDGRLYVMGTDTRTDQGFWLTSSDGVSWTHANTPSRFFRGHSWRGAMYIGATDRTSNGPAGIYRYAGGESTLVHSVSEHYATNILDWDDALFAGTSSGWKTDVGTSRLVLSRGGAGWQPVCDFDELAVWALAVHDGHLYVGTWQFGSGGQIYRVDVDPEGRGG